MTDDHWLGGRVAFTTGGASGLGRATALALAEAGARVIVADMDAPGAARTVEEISTKGGEAEAAIIDVTDDAGRRETMAAAFASHGDAFDILVNVAGIDLPGYAHDIALTDFERVMAVNCTAPAFLMSEFIKVVKDRPADRMAEIVNIISLSAITVGSGAAAYNGSKAAFAKVTECYQREILEFGWPCRIQGIMPAAMDTPMMERWGIPAERMMPPSDVAAEVLHCLRRPVTAYGQNLVVVPRREPDFPR
ncbi:MAG TPA: SDR family oxidoreductase [Acidimicrobiales bacterium]|nr:SDR family oxidoreductase [Acidimicrobiales bacterium]